MTSPTFTPSKPPQGAQGDILECQPPKYSHSLVFQNSRISTHWTHRSRIRENPEGSIPHAERRPQSRSQFQEHNTSDDTSQACQAQHWNDQNISSHSKRMFHGGTRFILRQAEASTSQTTRVRRTKEEKAADSGLNPSSKPPTPLE